MIESILITGAKCWAWERERPTVRIEARNKKGDSFLQKSCESGGCEEGARGENGKEGLRSRHWGCYGRRFRKKSGGGDKRTD